MIRDYSLIGQESKTAVEKGLADANWYTSPVPKDKMQDLLKRKNGPAIRDTLLWFGLIIGSGYLVYYFWGTYWAILPYIVYSVLYASTSDSRWHESSHGTAFKSDWMNNALYEIASFMVLRQSTVWRYSHTRHHSDTIIRGRDPEIAIPRPPNILQSMLVFVGISSSIPEFKKMFTHAGGKIDKQVATFLPENEYRKVIIKARIYLLIYAVVIGLAIYFKSVLPLMYIGLPTILGSWLMPVYGYTQHAGLEENVLDHRLNCRTVYMNRIHRYLYWNMNYHIEHHMYPLVPYHALPKLHELMKDDCPKPYSSIFDAYKEIIPTILKQVKDPSYYAKRELPEESNHGNYAEKNNMELSWENVDHNMLKICKIEHINPGEVKRFDFEKHTFALYKTEKENVYVSDGFCTHGNAHLADGMIIGDVIECSKHNGRFNLKDGSPKRPPVCLGVKTHSVEIIDEHYSINIDRLNTSNEKVYKYKVVSNKNVATFIKELVLAPLTENKITYQPGQYVQFEIPPHKSTIKDIDVDETYQKAWDNLDCEATNKIYVTRNYSLATNPSKGEVIKFNIRLSLPPEGNNYKMGIGSSYLFGLKPGSEVELNGPFGDFFIKESDNEMIYIGGGAGMAPLKSHLASLFETKTTERKVSYWYGARSINDLFYLDYFNNLEKEFGNFTFYPALSEPNANEQWDGKKGFITDVLYNEYLKDHSDIKNIEFYLCGPPALIKSGLEMLKKLGIKESMIAYDEF